MAYEAFRGYLTTQAAQKIADEYVAMIEFKREQHRVKMVDFRRRKKEMKSKLQNEHRRLENKMKQLVTNLWKESENCTSPQNKQYLLRKVIEENESLRHQNAALHEEIKHHEVFHNIIKCEQRLYSKTECPKLSIPPGIEGMWVHFTNGAPSFVFHPFSTEELDATMDPMSHEFVSTLNDIPTQGFLFGWNVHRELEFRSDSQRKPVSSRMRFTKRVHCSIELAYDVAYVQERDLRPLLLTPIDWTCNKRDKVATHVLQEYGSSTRVMLHSIPGSTYLQYIFLARTAQWHLQNGKCRMGFSMIATDSKANNHIRGLVSQENVKWITEGWASFVVTEVDSNTIDVVYEHCIGCERQTHADKFFIELAQFVYRWEQAVQPSILLNS